MRLVAFSFLSFFLLKYSPLKRLTQMQKTFINYVDKEYQRYRNACTFNHKGCTKINNLKTIELIKACQVKCQYSYEYN